MISIQRFAPIALLAVSGACRTGGDAPPDRPPETSTAAIPALPAVPLARPSADEPAAKPASGSRAARFAAVRSEHEAAMEAYYALFRAAKDEEEMKRVAETSRAPDEAPFLARARAILDEDPRDATAFEVLAWMLRVGTQDASDDSIVSRLEQHHFQNADLGPLCATLARARSPRGPALVARLGSESRHETVRAHALFALAEREGEAIESAEQLRGLSDPEELAQWKSWVGESEVARLTTLDLDAARARVEALLERVAREYGSVPSRSTTFGKRAAAELFERRNLVVGKVAPDIAGEDLAGVAFRLSDYRGKVVLLDFWGNW